PEPAFAELARARELGLLFPGRARPREGPGSADAASVGERPDQRERAVSRQRDAAPELPRPRLVGGRQFFLQGPFAAFAREHPGGAGVFRAPRVAHQGRAAIGRDGHATSEEVRAFALRRFDASLLGPFAPGAGEDPSRAGAAGFARAADE